MGSNFFDKLLGDTGIEAGSKGVLIDEEDSFVVDGLAGNWQREIAPPSPGAHGREDLPRSGPL